MLPVHSLQTEFDRLYREMQALYHEAAVAVGLSDSGLTVMYAICELGEGCRQKDICQRCSSPKQTIHSAVRKLVEAGLVRTESGKGHELHLYLTPEDLGMSDAEAEEAGVGYIYVLLQLSQKENGQMESWIAIDLGGIMGAEVELSGSVTPALHAPQTTPPAGEQVVDYEEWAASQTETVVR